MDNGGNFNHAAHAAPKTHTIGARQNQPPSPIPFSAKPKNQNPCFLATHFLPPAKITILCFYGRHMTFSYAHSSLLLPAPAMDISDLAWKLGLPDSKPLVRKAEELRRLCDVRIDASVFGIV